MSEDQQIIKRGNLFATENPGLSGTKIDVIKSITQVMSTVCLEEWMDIIKSKKGGNYAVVIRSAYWDPNLTKVFLNADSNSHNSKSFEAYKLRTSIETIEDLQFEITEKDLLDRLKRFVSDPLVSNILSVICCDMKCFPFRYYAFHVLINDE